MSFFDPMPRSLAHRGNSKEFPENTEPAFRSALELGVDVIETDVHITKDRKVLISHDPGFKRAAGDERLIADLNWEEIQMIDLGFNFSLDGGSTYPYRAKGIRPLLLDEALTLFPRTRFNIDLKVKGKVLARAAAKVIADRHAQDRVCVGSFHHDAISEFRKNLPRVATSLSQQEIVRCLILHKFAWVPVSVKKGMAKAVQIPEYSGRHHVLTPSFYHWCRKNNLIIQVWTVNDRSEMKRLFERGVDGIFSDIPQDIIAVSRDFFGE